MNDKAIQLLTVIWLTAMLTTAPTPLPAHDQIPGSPQSEPIVITGATIHPIDRPAIKDGVLLFEQGKITAVGKAVVIPDDAIEIDRTGMHVYPGLIESLSDIGLREVESIPGSDDRREFGDRNPNARSWVAVNPDSELIPVARAGGVLLTMTAPQGTWLRGQTAILQLDGWTVDDMIVSAPAGLYVDWSTMNRRGDTIAESRVKQEQRLADLDALLDEARRYDEARQSEPEQTPSDLRLESLIPVIRGQRPVFAQANTQVEIESAVAYAQTHGLQLVIYGGYDAANCAELLTTYDVPVIVGSTYRLPLRRDDPYDSAYTLPNRLRESGVRFAIGGEGARGSGGSSNARNLPYHAAAAAAYGLPYAAALRSITLSAAEILGVAERIGSITVGKDATIIIADGDILETETNVTAAFIQGRQVDLGSRHKTLYEKYRRKYARPDR